MKIFNVIFRNEEKKHDPEYSDTVGMLFTDEDRKVKSRFEMQGNNRIIISKDGTKRNPEFSSLSEIFGDKVEFDMSTIKEMVESLEDDTLQFKGQVSTEDKNNMASKEDANSFEKIMMYMKKEIKKIDSVKKKEKDTDKVKHLMKNFIDNLKRIDLSPRVLDAEDA